jgi:hypothetical protein
MKFIAGLLVWVSRGIGKTPQVFPRLGGSASSRVDLHLPLIASIAKLAMFEETVDWIDVGDRL